MSLRVSMAEWVCDKCGARALVLGLPQDAGDVEPPKGWRVNFDWDDAVCPACIEKERAAQTIIVSKGGNS